MVSLCKGLTLFSAGDSCEGLDVALSNPKLPMPEPGKEFVLDAGQLETEERAQLDAYLARGHDRQED